MIRVSIEANDGAHLRHLLVGMLAGSNASAAPVPPAAKPAPEPRDTASDDTSQMQSTGPLTSADTSSTAPSGDVSANRASSSGEPPAPGEQRKRGRPPKAKAEPPAPTGEAPAPADAAPAAESEPAANPEATTPPATLDLSDVRAGLQSYAATHGVPAAGKLLEKYGATKVSELKPEQYAAFFAECKA